MNKITEEEIWSYLKNKSILVNKIFYLYYAEGLTLKQISIELNINESTIKSNLYRTKQEIRNIFKEQI